MSRPHDSLDLDQLLAHGDFVRALARSLMRDPSRAEDIEQDTWVAALERPPRQAAGRGLKAWLASVAHNFARQSARREGRGLERERRSARSEGLPSTAEVVQREATRQAVVEAVLALEEHYRDVLLLRYYHEIAPRDIARRLALPVETVRTRLRRGLDKLRARLDAQGGGRDAWAGALVPLATEQHPVPPSSAPVAVMAAGVGLGIAVMGLAVWWMRGGAESLAVASVVPDPSSKGAPTASSDRSAASLASISHESARESMPPPMEAPSTEPASLASQQEPSEVRYVLVPPERRITGRVLDERDQPIAGALVYVGNQIRARGDEPFKPFQERRISDGVRTDPTGGFELTGRGRSLTAWHPEHGAHTVPWEEAEQIVLRDKVSLSGVLIDGKGQPLGGRPVALDRGEVEAETSADGSFAFDGLPIGNHGLRIEGGPYFVVDLPPGGREPVTVVLDSRPITIELRSGDEPYLQNLEGAWVGVDAAKPLEPFRAEGGAGVVSNLTPGRYLLLLAGARAIPVDLPAGADVVRVDLGTAELTVRGPARTRVYLVPQGSSEFVQLMAGRVCSTFIPESGLLQLSELHPGSYAIGIDREGLLGPVEVGPEGATVILE